MRRRVEDEHHLADHLLHGELARPRVNPSRDPHLPEHERRGVAAAGACKTTPQVLLVGAQSVSAATPLPSLQCGAVLSLTAGTVAPKSAYAQRTPTPILEQFQDLTKKT